MADLAEQLATRYAPLVFDGRRILLPVTTPWGHESWMRLDVDAAALESLSSTIEHEGDPDGVCAALDLVVADLAATAADGRLLTSLDWQGPWPPARPGTA